MNRKGRPTHGLSKHPLYSVWKDMKKRCYGTKSKYYHNYGGRGITVCEEWKTDFKAFYDWAIKNGHKEGLTIDRKDNDKGYSPNNCRWATRSMQSSNQRKRKGSSSKYKGVHLDKASGKWKAQIRIVGGVKHIGLFGNETDAAKAYNEYVALQQKDE